VGLIGGDCGPCCGLKLRLFVRSLIGMLAAPCCVRCERKVEVSGICVILLIYLFLWNEAVCCTPPDVDCVSCFPTDTLFVCIVVCSLSL